MGNKKFHRNQTFSRLCETMPGEEGKMKVVVLHCPCSSRTLPFTVDEEEKLDIGYVSRVFGLDPRTIKLNGYFISRGSDLVACFVTWKSLLSFFGSKGLATGRDGDRPVVVQGKVLKSGSKRLYDPEDGQCGIPSVSGAAYLGESLQIDTFNMNRKNKLSKTNEGYESGYLTSSNSKGKSSKRKYFFEDLCGLKKLHINETQSLTSPEGENSLLQSCVRTHFPSCHVTENVKRTREDDASLTTRCKKIRC